VHYYIFIIYVAQYIFLADILYDI